MMKNKKIGSMLIFLALAIASVVIAAPTANNDIATVSEDQWVLIDVLANDVNVTIDSVTQPANGIAAIVGGQKINYTPSPNYNGVDIFTYTGNSSTATVTVTVDAVNDAPVITSTPGTTATEKVQYTYNLVATDVDGDTLIYSLTAKPTGMTIVPGTGVISWTPENNDTYSVTASVSDGTVSVTQSWNISVGVGIRLEITDLDVKVDGETDKNLDDGDSIGEDALPGSTVQLKIEITNEFSDDEDVEIEDIEVTVTIFDIEDGDDLEEEADSFDLKPGKDERLTFIFEVPLLVDEESYDVLISVEAEDEDGRSHNFEWDLTLDVDKKKHELLINQAELATSTFVCRRTTSLHVEVINIGSDDEDEVVVEVRNDELDINYRDVDIELDEGSDEDSVFEKAYGISVSDGQEAGIYPITVKTFYDTTKLKDSKTVELVVQDCAAAEEEEEELIDVDTTDEEEEMDLIIPEKEFTESTTYIALLVLINLLVLGALVYAIGTALKK